VSDEFYGFDDEDFDVDEDDEDYDCGMLFDEKGRPMGCQLAGSEDCDFDCPYRAEFEQEAEEMTTNKLWWAKLNTSSPRYREWYGILDSDDVPLIQPQSTLADLGPEKDVEIYALDWQNLDEGQSERLLTCLSRKFGADSEVIQHDLDRDGHLPIRAADVTVFYDARAFL
jgi:hypothetical protein